jgi:putative colanic acid biosynthesis acetyltransferase WcaF
VLNSPLAADSEMNLLPETETSAIAQAVDLSHPDNSDYQVGRSRLYWALWHFVGSPIVRSNLLPISRLKVAVLRLFGARIGRGAYFKPGVKVKFPWYLTIGDYSWIGEDAWIDNLAPVTIGSHVCISQAAYLCTGNHDWTSPNMRLFRRPIFLEDGSWVGARAIISPGVTLGAGAIAAAGSVITKNIPSFEIWAGNPAAYVKARVLATSGK